MEIEDFVEIFCSLSLPESLDEFELVIHGEVFFRYACAKNRELGGLAEVLWSPAGR